MVKMRCLIVWFVLGVSAAFADEPSLQVTCPRGSHLYEVGERAEFDVTSAVTGTTVRIAFSRGNVKSFESMTTTTPVRVSCALGEPGFVLCTVREMLPDGKLGQTVRAGAGFEPHRIRTALPPPKDYDAFWESAFAEQAAIPADFQVRPISNGVSLVSCQTVRNTRMYGFLFIPKGSETYPLMVQVGGGDSLRAPDVAASSAAAWAKRKRGFLLIHLPPWEPSVPGGEIKARHKAWLAEAGVKGSLYSWNDDKGPRERWYYRCILGSCRLIEYAATRPEVDRSRVYYEGASTGGGYGVFLAAFSPHIRAAACLVPNYGNASGPSVGRPSGEDDRGAHWQTSLYYDAAYCAPRITCPVFMSCGYIDCSCCPETVYCIYNALRCRKVMYDKVENGHGDVPRGFDDVRTAWLEATFGM